MLPGMYVGLRQPREDGEYCMTPPARAAAKGTKGDVTRDDSKRRFLAQRTVAMLEQCCNYSKQCRNNVATLCCASSRVTSPLHQGLFKNQRGTVLSGMLYLRKEKISTRCYNSR